ncbi:SET domain-containing protein-lysine N-methyltransferase [uncultured Aquimonas sp.]|uniref:SET domain-containing protein n=1 Tax=uncultured Aquimonas sp. TaxID=385483 RepID=UPI00086ED67D|nr:SET domain-containing protein-lysine N-methyltransferase [uncultured Aquimonas sp.]ODU44998.1 MAG: SET domain-containing protein-lysine N-methyltransferase [Xanthomonadaceae bacterium SCN 69-123]
MSRRIQQRRSRIHGNGVFAAADIAAGTRLVEYKGLRRTHEDADALYGDSLDTGHTFLFTLNDDYLIDANVDGNVARWINHSCAPNCQAVLEEDPKGNPQRDRVFIESLRELKAGEELTYNYGIRLSVPHTAKLKKQWACRCGAPECTGTMLQPKG